MDQTLLDASNATLVGDPNSTVHAPINSTASINVQLASERALSAKYAVLCDALEELDIDALNLPAASSEALRQTTDQLLCAEFVTLSQPKGSKITGGSGAPAHILGLTNFSDPPAHSFSYADRKAIRTAVVDAAERRSLRPVLEFIADKRRQPAAFNVFRVEQMRRESLDLEQQRQRLETDLLRAQQTRHALLRRAVELRCAGGSTAIEMDECVKRLQLNGEKVALLQAMIERAYVNSSEHTAAALKCIDGHLDEALSACRK